jgi:Protein of unknown function DUF262/Protein of unknown function (DUF1524)
MATLEIGTMDDKLAPSFGAQLLTLPHIFDNHLFTIPNYQRSYAWDDKQVEELLRDVGHLIDDQVDQRHYTGTIVLSRPSQVANGEYHIVDGQQRLTTLVILMSLVVDHLPATEKAAFSNRYLRRGELGSDRAVLKLNSDTRTFFERAVLGGDETEPATLEAHERLRTARRLIHKWIAGRLESGTSIHCIVNTLEQELGFLVYAPREDAETGIMFEVINNRGKALSELEKVKNYLIYCCVKLSASTLRTEIDADWSEMLRDLNTAKKTSAQDEGAFLRYCMVVHFGLSKTDSQNGYEQLKRLIALEEIRNDAAKRTEAIHKMTAFVRCLKSAALWYSRLYGRRHGGLESALIAMLDQLRGQDRHASIMPLFLALVMKHDSRGDVLVRMLTLLERVNFRVYMSRNATRRNDSGQADLYAYAANYRHGTLVQYLLSWNSELNREIVVDEESALVYALVEFTLSYSTEEGFEKSLRLDSGSSDDFFHWTGLRYFLMSYEQHLNPHKTILIDRITNSRSEVRTGDYLSIEHIWAQQNRSAEGENNRQIDLFEKRRLGNLALLELRLNIQGSDAGIEQKISRYLDGIGEEPATELHQVRIAAKTARDVLAEQSNWTRSKNYYLGLYKTINDRREESMIKFALERWSVKDYACYELLSAEAE